MIEIEQPRAELDEEEQLEWALRLYLEGFIFLLLTPTILIVKSKLSRETVEDQEVKVKTSLQLEMMTSLPANQLRVNLLSPV